MKTFILYWKGGDQEVVKGETVAQAMTLAGYGGGAVAALDVYTEGTEPKYTWDPEKRDWIRIES